MADEAEDIEQDTEVVDAVEKSPLEAFDDFLSGQAGDAQPPAENEDAPDDETPVEEPAGEVVEEQAVEPEPEPVADGPSFVMKQVALSAGIPQSAVDRAPNDAALQWLVQEVRASAGPTPQETPKEEPIAKVTLPEDEYGPDDPVRQQMQALVDALNAERAERLRGEKELKDAKQRQDAREFNEQFTALYKPFDDTLDSYDSPKLGNAQKGLTPQQHAVRKAIADRYQGLGADVSTPVEEKRRLTELALLASDPSVVDQRNKKLQAVKAQPQRVTGGTTARNVRTKTTVDDIVREWDEALQGRKPLLTE